MVNIKFNESTHTYTIDGAIVPSVSELVSFALGNKYRFVDRKILKNACDFGIDIHNAIYHFEINKIEPIFSDFIRENAFNQYLKFKDKYITGNVIMEQIVSYKKRYCGRLDCLVLKGKKNYLIDFKTNTKIDLAHLQLQLGFYKLALAEQHIHVSKCLCLHIPKGRGASWHAITVSSKKSLLKILEDYENQKK